jgi:rSAM/selenodomain-associated transferase 1
VFAKAPVPGEVKTRLARTLGNDAAAAAYRELVERTLATADVARSRGIVAEVELWCSPDVAHPALDQWSRSHGASLHRQHGDDLGARMRGALASALARGDVPLLIGTDCPAIDADYLASASSALDTHDAVFGPVEDGGYALVGLARDADAFTGIAWSTPSVMPATRAALRRAGVRWAELPTLWDVDTADDLARWRAPGARAA